MASEVQNRSRGVPHFGRASTLCHTLGLSRNLTPNSFDPADFRTLSKFHPFGWCHAWKFIAERTLTDNIQKNGSYGRLVISVANTLARRYIQSHHPFPSCRGSSKLHLNFRMANVTYGLPGLSVTLLPSWCHSHRLIFLVCSPLRHLIITSVFVILQVNVTR